jgi:hypothetical protein
MRTCRASKRLERVADDIGKPQALGAL